MNKKQLTIKIENSIYETIAENICKKENNHFTEAFKNKLITALELIENSRMKIITLKK